jgi:hypothetical protein
MSTRFGRSALLFYSITAAMAAIVVLSVLLSLTWINRPFAGFLSYAPPYAGSMSLKDWPGEEGGIKFLERVVSVDGKAVTGGKDVTEHAGDTTPGTPLRYLMESKGETREVTLPVSLFGLRDYILTSVLTVVGGAIIFGLGIIVYVLKPGVPASWVFLFFCLFLGTYMVTSFEILSTYRLVNIHYAALSFMGTALFHLGLLFPEKKTILERRPRMVYLLYVPSMALTILYEIYFSYFPEIMAGEAFNWMPGYKTLGILVRVWLLTCVIGMVVSVVISFYRATSVTARQRARIILFGVTFAFLPCAGLQMGYFIFHFDFPWNFLVFFIILFPASVGYAIARHNLFDADAIIKRTVGYAVVTGIVVGAYVLVSVFSNMFLGKYQLAQSRTFPIFFTLGVILVFNPLRDRVQAAVDRLFFRAEYDYGAIVERTSRAMTSLLDLDEILQKLTKTFIDDLFLDSGSVILLGADGSEYKVFLAEGARKQEIERVVLERDQSLMQIVEAEKRELTRLDVLEDPKYAEMAESCAASFDSLHASLIVPLVFQDKVIGSLNLGDKKSGRGYKREDVDLLRTIASQGAVAIENARLFKDNLEKQRMEEELAIARDLQMSMFPASCPKISCRRREASSGCSPTSTATSVTSWPERTAERRKMSAAACSWHCSTLSSTPASRLCGFAAQGRCSLFISRLQRVKFCSSKQRVTPSPSALSRKRPTGRRSFSSCPETRWSSTLTALWRP